MPAEVTDASSPDRDQISERCGWRACLGRFFGRANSAFSYLIGLPIITLLGGLLVGYYQYLNAYQDKIRARGESDATMATAVFTDISRKFSQAQMLQQALLLNVSNAFDESASIDERVIAAKYAKSVSDTYEKSWVALLESGDLMARSAEIHIDWATDFKRGPGVSHYPNSDPLSRSLLAAYNFDCNDNLPKFVPTKSNRKRKTETCHVDDDQNPAPFEDSYVNLCPRRHGEVDPGSSVLTIQWYSAKHQVLTMHYCFHVLHQRLAKMHAWALHDEPRPATKLALPVERDQIQREIDNQAARLEAFMGLASFQIEAIQVKYRPVSFVCHLPFATPLVSWWNDACTPVRTTPYLREKQPDKEPSKPASNLVSAVAPP